MVDRLNGMFAFCIWDERTGEAFLARDHAGIKPLYLADTGDALFFASEPKALLALGSRRDRHRRDRAAPIPDVPVGAGRADDVE